MATASEIAVIRELIPADDTTAWTDARIGQQLDDGDSTAVIMTRYWGIVAANAASLVSVSESGSTRDLSSIYTQAKAMLDYWQKLADGEAASEDSSNAPIKIHDIVRGKRK